MRGDDELDLDAAERMIRPNTKLCIVSHASNVSGTILPSTRTPSSAGKRYLLCVDAAQTAGHYPIDLRKIAVDALCVPGHKGLQGPGGMRNAAEHPLCRRLEPLITAVQGAIPTAKSSQGTCPIGSCPAR
jgi:selenocysteine lyase/cysteine desulfurase